MTVGAIEHIKYLLEADLAAARFELENTKKAVNNYKRESLEDVYPPELREKMFSASEHYHIAERAYEQFIEAEWIIK